MELPGKNIVKYIIYVLGVLLVALGITGIVFGVLILSGNTFLQTDVKNIIICASLFIAGGVAMFPAIVLGPLGVLKDSATLLKIYTIPMLIGLLLAIVSLSLLRGALNSSSVRDRLETALNNYNTSKADRRFWKHLQREYKCCGIYDYYNWMSNGISLPESCCQKNPSDEAPDENESCKAIGKDLNYVYSDGCHQELVDAQDRFYTTVIVLKVVFIACVVLAVAAAIWLVLDIMQIKFHWTRGEQ